MSQTIQINSIVVFSLLAQFSNAKTYTSPQSNKAADRYDVVTYFIQNKLVNGDKKCSYQYKDSSWLFAPKKKLETFMKPFNMHAQQFGDHCALAVAQKLLSFCQPFGTENCRKQTVFE